MTPPAALRVRTEDTHMSVEGSLRTFLGTAPGVGKTYAMLAEGRRRAGNGERVVVGWLLRQLAWAGREGSVLGSVAGARTPTRGGCA